MYSKILGQNVKYSIVLPENYYKNKHAYPVVYLLHGLGDDETSWIEYGRIGQIAGKAIAEKEIIPMIFVIPQGFRTYYVNDFANTFRYQDMFVQELIPFIDSCYRTIADKKHRATLGYSMGGFGALIIPLKNPEIINTCVPLSISIRTDKKYMEEYGPEWDKQWGSLFGGVGKTGVDRITDYYKQNYPFHIFMQDDLSKLKELNIYIDNGDDEQTLCRSNEELHMLLRDRNFPHQFRVRNGGHEFSYWREALKNGLNFISDAFEGKAYRGDIINPAQIIIPFNNLQKIKINNLDCDIYLPDEYQNTTRLYPVIYFAGDFLKNEKKLISGLITQNIDKAYLPQVIAVFVPLNVEGFDDEFFAALSKEFRIRQGFRFKAIFAYGKGGQTAILKALSPEQFTFCASFDVTVSKDEPEKILSGFIDKSLKRTWFYIASPDKGQNYQGNGNLHMLFRDLDIYHEYRVSEGDGGFEWFIGMLPEAFSYFAKKIHN